MASCYPASSELVNLVRAQFIAGLREGASLCVCEIQMGSESNSSKSNSEKRRGSRAV